MEKRKNVVDANPDHQNGLSLSQMVSFNEKSSY
jgi:hypothetical protein